MEQLSMILFWTTAAVLAYVLCGYSLTLVILARFFPSRKPAAGDAPFVSLIIPAHNEESVLEEKLENSLAIDYPADRLEILVASDGSIDDTVDIARRFESDRIRVLDFQPRRGKASAVNDAVAEARGDVLCLCDANVMFHSDALPRLVGHLHHPKIGAATGRVQLASDQSNFGRGERFYYRLERAIQVAESRVGSLMGVDGGMYVMHKSLFRPLPADTLLDDFSLSMKVLRQGRAIHYEPDAVADESGTPRAMQEFRRRVRMAAGIVQVLRRGDFPSLRNPILCWQFLSHKLLRWMGPVFLPLLFVSSLVLWPRGIVYQAALLVQVAVYLAAALGAVSVSFRQTPLGGIPFYFVLGYVAMAVGYVRGMFNLQQVTWAQADRQDRVIRRDPA